MANRWEDWFGQARRDIAHCRHSIEMGDYEWACFAAHQAAEKALKALLMSNGIEAWGHSVKGLLEAVARTVDGAVSLLSTAMQLDKLYIPTRYPNGFDSGYPAEYYLEKEARSALSNALSVIEFCEQVLSLNDSNRDRNDNDTR